ncbi:MAG: hypothetical protein KAS32_00120 [Candidatus Peribacteraceae bacterium]|nr:hypothetical protein [Candidatus Peribacteraceae bacterium]
MSVTILRDKLIEELKTIEEFKDVIFVDGKKDPLDDDMQYPTAFIHSPSIPNVSIFQNTQDEVTWSFRLMVIMNPESFDCPDDEMLLKEKVILLLRKLKTIRIDTICARLTDPTISESEALPHKDGQLLIFNIEIPVLEIISSI